MILSDKTKLLTQFSKNNSTIYTSFVVLKIVL
jgi:hypothetical protein